jgi:hypothetical protein
LATSFVTVADTEVLLAAIMEAGGNCVIATDMTGVCVEGFAALVLHPVITPKVAKLHRMATNPPIQSFRRPPLSVLT